MELLDRLKFLKSAWGLLSCASVFFPGAAHLLNAGEIKSSPLSTYYVATAVPLGALSLLLTLLLAGRDEPRSKFSQIAITSVLIGAIVLGIFGLTGFISLSSSRNDSNDFERDPSFRCSGVDVFGKAFGDGFRILKKTSGGRVTERKTPCVVSPPGFIGEVPTGEETIRTYISSEEYSALSLFDLCFISLTVTFTILAVELTRKKSQVVPKKLPGSPVP